MYAKLLGLLLFACQIILNKSHVIHDTPGEITNAATTLTSASSTLPEGYVSFPDLNLAYKIHTTSVTWVEARDQCIAEGAHLAITDTVEKIKRIYAMPSKFTDWISVGIHKSNTSDNWVRVDNGLPLAFIPWKIFNPDDAGDCTAISFNGISLVNCDCNGIENWYVCEIGTSAKLQYEKIGHENNEYDMEK